MVTFFVNDRENDNANIMKEAGPEEISRMNQSDRITQLSPQEEALQSLCKSLLKSRIFRGFYIERRFVQPIEKYRDLVSLHRTEKELEKILIDISRRIQLFYAHSNSEDMWIGVTHGPLIGTTVPSGSSETFIWVELDELAFGQYWFSLKSVRFRQNEIILKLKMIREVEDERPSFTPLKRRRTISPKGKETPSAGGGVADDENEKTPFMENTSDEENVEQDIHLADFIEVIRQWGPAIKRTIYEFMAKDINKENIIGVLRFFGILIFSLISAAIVGLKFLGIFTIRFMLEISRLTHALTPVTLKIIDVLSKIVGGFYILIAMIWRDTFGKKHNALPQMGERNFHELPYDRPIYRTIKYEKYENKNRQDRKMY